MKWTALIAASALAVISLPSLAEDVTVTVNKIDDKGVGEAIGTIKLSDSPHGLTLTPKLKGLTPGIHGIHVHENGDCGTKEKEGKMVPGLAAGGHFDPSKAGKHEGPAGAGHMGDLPALEVAADGSATHVAVAGRVKLADVKGHAIIIHDGGDNFSDQPKPLGGGGARVACGLIK